MIWLINKLLDVRDNLIVSYREKRGLCVLCGKKLDSLEESLFCSGECSEKVINQILGL